MCVRFSSFIFTPACLELPCSGSPQCSTRSTARGTPELCAPSAQRAKARCASFDLCCTACCEVPCRAHRTKTMRRQPRSSIKGLTNSSRKSLLRSDNESQLTAVWFHTRGVEGKGYRHVVYRVDKRKSKSRICITVGIFYKMFHEISTKPTRSFEGFQTYAMNFSNFSSGNKRT